MAAFLAPDYQPNAGRGGDPKCHRRAAIGFHLAVMFSLAIGRGKAIESRPAMARFSAAAAAGRLGSSSLRRADARASATQPSGRPWTAEAVRVLKFGGCRCIGPGHEIGRFPSAEIAIGADLRQAFQDKPSAALTARIASHWSRYSTAKPRSSTSVTQTTPAGFATLPALSTVICCQSRRFSGHDLPGELHFLDDAGAIDAGNNARCKADISGIGAV